MAAIQVEIVTPTEVVFTGEATEVRAPGFFGEFGVLPDHAPFLSVVKPGVVVLSTSEGTETFVVGRGFVEAGPDRVVILVQSTQVAAEVDKTAAQRLLEESEKAMAAGEPGTAEYAVSVHQAEMARAQLSV